MWKGLIVLAITANTFFITPSEAYKCKINEVYDKCPATCPPQECGINKALILCAPSHKCGDPECKPGCRCADGHLRNKTGVCIPEDECPIECPENEVFDDCPAPCPPQECGINRDLIRCPAPSKPGSSECKPSCRCADDFVRNKEGVCILEDDCPEYDCPENEVFDDCPAPCPPLRCDVNKAVIKCAVPPKPGSPDCEPSCRCADGFLRNKVGKCIPENECPIVCGVNEQISNCSNGGCGPWTCSDLGFRTGCIKMDPKNCKVGCVCKKGFVKNDNGICIPSTDCPECGGDPNAISGCGINCGRLCSNYNKGPVFCTLECRENACDCRKHYVLNEKTNKCVKPKDCPRVCGKHEIYDSCANGGCDKRNCSELGEPDICRDVNKCIGGCVCKKGYLRTEHGVCVLIRECPGPTCSRHERFEWCPDSQCIPRSCSELGFPVKCPEVPENSTCSGKPRCVCKRGYVRNDHEKCIRKKYCPSCGGDPKAESGCDPNGCNRLCSSYDKDPVPCSKICRVNSCRCKKHHVYDEIIKKCVRPRKCTPVCGIHEVYSDCINGGCTPKNCSQLGEPIPSIKIDPKHCIKGCVCKEGYLRNDDGCCVPEDLCFHCKKAHEHYETCVPTCPPQTCESIGRKYKCPETKHCKGGCVCNYGYHRNYLGDCITKKECLKCAGRNEYFSCGGACDNVCSTLHKQNQTNCPIVNLQCTRMCYCKKGYARDADNICIPIDQCPAKVCGKHEIYDPCANGGCDKRYCSELGEPDSCRDVKKCIGGCVCKKGYLRTKHGVCVPIKECPIPTCPKNERFEWCPDNQCVPRSCSQLGFPIKCPKLPEGSACRGPPRCICNENHVRNGDGKCIPKKQCPSCGGDPNAESGCGTNYCNRLCSNYDKEPVACKKICEVNACDCKKGLVFDENIQKCVHPKKCTPVCRVNEVFSECINGGCSAKNCSQLGKPVPCIKINAKDCIKGCLCKKGYLRADDGVCVPEDQCKQCNQPHEHYDSCAPTCPPQTCESIGKTYHCPITAQVCSGACRCDKGYLRNLIGQCITKKECLQCNGPHEYFTCGGACDNVCATLNKQNQTHCPIINIQCNRMCYCEKGYARDANKICIPISKCPAPQCKDDERYEECPDWLCTPQNCSQVGFPIACPALSGDNSGNATCPGKPACVCDNKYVRNKYGKCIPPTKCPSCGGDPNAVYSCGSNCGKRCSTYKKQPAVCPLICRINGCDCKVGFAYDDNLGKCVRPEHCTPVCGKHEVYDSCANGGCRKWNCSQFEQPILCIDPLKCIGGCVCQKGYLRAKNGTCIPEYECPGICQRPHEIYDPCPPTCPPQTCDSLTKKYFCPANIINGTKNCKGACRCEKGYYRNNKGECISKSDCLICGPNEYFSCGSACDNECSSLSKQNQTNCPIINKKCTSKCYCNEGYARDDNGICIPVEQCGVCCNGDPNAVPGCGQHCGNRCSNYNKGAQVCSEICKEDDCDCKNTYVFDDNLNICVQPKKCTPICRKDEVFNGCINGGCQKKLCSDLGRPDICVHPAKCIPGCLCKDGLLRASNGTCVPIKQCPIECNKPHEVYSDCPITCPPQTCDSLDKAYICPIESGQDPRCTPGCVCEDGYFRNNNSECVTEEDCSPVNNTEATAKFNEAAIILSSQSLYYLASRSPDENIVISATSILLAFAQLALFTTGLVLEQFYKLFNLKSKAQMKSVFPELIKSYANLQHVEFEVANKCYANKDYPLSPYFKQDIKKYFNTTADNLDFSKPVEAAKVINDWAKDRTHGKIQDLVKPDMLSAATRLVVLNAIYFMGNWIHQFNENNTEYKDFHKSNGETVSLEMMYQQNSFDYAETKNYQVLKMDYKGNEFSCVIVLPKERGGLLELVTELGEPNTFLNMINSMQRKTVQVSLPKFKVETDADVKNVLIKNNYTAMFDPKNNDFDGILEVKEPLYVSTAVQKAYIAVNEKGTEAAAVTAVIGFAATAIEEPPEIFVFNADHPYIFYILFDDDPLFCGLFIGAK